jgi:hypothetical protein
VSLTYEATRTLAAVEFELRYYSADGKTVVAAARTGARGEPVRIDTANGTLTFTVASLPLTPGAYYLGALVREFPSGRTLAWWDGETRLFVREPAPGSGLVQIPHEWRHVQTANPRHSPPG